MLVPLSASGENVEDSLIVGMISTRTTEIRPLTPQERDIVSLYGVVYESLVTVDDNGLPQPLLAESWTESGGGQTWTFTLRENITFSDGTPLTAQDVVASGQYILNLAKNDQGLDRGFYGNIRYMVSSFTAQDDRTVVVKAARDYYGLLYSMTFPVVPASQVEMANPVGTGPYVISSFEPASYMLLNANPAWWQTQPQVQEITVTFYPNNKDMINAYEYGRVDTVFTRSVAAAQYKSGINSLSISYSTRQLEVLLINHRERSFPLDSLKVRQAIRYMLDLDDIVNNVYYGMVTRTDTPLIPGTWTYWSENDAQQFNKQRAMELLDEAGWTDYDENGVRTTVRADTGKLARMHLRFYVYEEQENSVRVEVANRIADALMQVGIECKVETLTYKEARDKLKAGSYDLCLAAFNIDFTPDPGYLLISGNNCNYMRYKSTEMDNLFKTLRAAQEESAYRAALQSIQTLFWNDCPFVCLYYRNGSVLTRKMFTDARDVREPEVLRGIETFKK